MSSFECVDSRKMTSVFFGSRSRRAPVVILGSACTEQCHPELVEGLPKCRRVPARIPPFIKHTSTRCYSLHLDALKNY